MTQQPEALRLADELERDKWHVPAVVMQAAADELRRLHATVQAREDEIETHSAAVYEATRLLSEVRAQRDALLEALKDMLNAENDYPYGGMSESEISAIRKARAAIAAVEGEKA